MKITIAIVLAFAMSLVGSAAMAQDIACSDEARTKSVQAGAEITLTFINTGETPIELNWLNYEGEREYFTRLYPGWKHAQRTYATHPWLLADDDGNCLRILVAPEVSTTMEISAP